MKQISRDDSPRPTYLYSGGRRVPARRDQTRNSPVERKKKKYSLLIETISLFLDIFKIGKIL